MTKASGWVGFWIALLVALFPSTAQAQANTGTGLWADYYDVDDMVTLTTSKLDTTIDFADFANPPAAGLTDDETFGVRWQGLVEGPVTGTVTFHFHSDDGVRLYIDGRLIIDRWRDQSPSTTTGTFNMTLDQRYSIRAEYFENGGGDVAQLSWSWAVAPAQAQIIVPMTRLYPEVPAPKITPSTSSLTNSAVVRLTSEMLGATIRYTLDGTDLATDGSNGLLYTGPFVRSATTTVKARAFRTGAPAGATGFSAQSTSTLTITDATAPALSRIETVHDNELLLTFSEALSAAAAETEANFTITPAGPTVATATLRANLVSVTLNTTGLVAGTNYVLNVSGVGDFAGNNLAAGGITRTFTYRPPAVANLVDWYRFDEGTGTAAADSSGSATGGNAGTAGPAAQPSLWVEGVYGTGIEFDGINDEITVADLATVVGDNVSLAFWSRTLAIGNGNDPNAGGNAGRVYGLIGGRVAADANDVYLGYIDAGGSGGRVAAQYGDSLPQIAPVSINDGAWHHVVITRVTASGLLTIYTDGVQRVSANGESGVKTPGAVNRIGVPTGTDAPFPRSSHWQGEIDELRIYNSNISQTDVYDLTNRAPVVNAGPDQVVTVLSATMAGSATDDGFPAPAAITFTWTQLSGPGTATFANAASATTGVTFSQGGTYVLRLTATDGRLASSDDMVVDLPTIAVSPLAVSATEGGATGSFDVVLTLQPQVGETVTINLTNGGVGQILLSAPSAVFDSTNWNVAQTITVTAVDDFLVEAATPYTITTEPAVSGDAAFSGDNPADVTATVTDNDTAGITVAPLALTVTEGALGVQFTVVLTSQPTGNVDIGISSSNPAEATVSTANLQFTNANWDIPQPVTVTAVDDALLDFTTLATILTAAATSGDANYTGRDASDVAVTILDNETIPPAPEAWGNCGLLGGEVLAPLLLAALLRRRRSKRA